MLVRRDVAGLFLTTVASGLGTGVAAAGVCGNGVNGVGLLNPTFGNTCVND